MMFKKYESKRQLREKIAELEKENAKLQDKVEMYLSIPVDRMSNIVHTEKNIHKISASQMISGYFMQNVPMEYIKEELVYKLAAELEQFVRWDIVDGEKESYKWLVGSLYVDMGK